VASTAPSLRFKDNAASVLRSSFSDGTGHFDVGDVEIAEEELDHTPIAGTGLPCICLAATDAPLRFHSFQPCAL